MTIKVRKKNIHQFLALCGWGDSNSWFIHFICDTYQLQETTVNRKSAKKKKKKRKEKERKAALELICMFK